MGEGATLGQTGSTNGGVTGGGSGGATGSGSVGGGIENVVRFGESSDSDVTGVTFDTYIEADSESNRNYGGAPELSLDMDSEQRILVRFDLSSLDPAAEVAGATFSIWTDVNGAGLYSGVVVAHRLLEAWDEGNLVNALGVANWNQRVAGTSWTTPGAGAGSMDTNALGQFKPEISQTRYQITLPASLVKTWISQPSTNHGIILIPMSSDTRSVSFASSESSRAALRPSLDVRVLQ